jgi:DNA-binding NarL/FixJ family response regulator
MQERRLRVVIIQSQALFAKALSEILAAEADVEVVSDHRTPDSARLAIDQPHVIVVDVDGQPTDLAITLGACTAAVPDGRICVLSMQLSSETMERCLAHGAEAYVVKDVSPPELVHAIKTVAAGQSYVDPRVAGGLLRDRVLNGSTRDGTELSARETIVLKLIAEGLANKQIGERLRLSEKTIKRHVARIFAKLNISARAQAAVYAVRVGLV